jgi:DNA repair exonuclease SbcCD ATPase subunit
MTTDTATPAELVDYLQGEMRKLETRAARLREQVSGRSLKSDFQKLAGVQMELETVEGEIARLRDELAEARRAEEEERSAAARHDAYVREARRDYEATSPSLTDACRRIHVARQRLIGMGQPDPGDRLLSVEAIATPILERDAIAAANERAMFERERATPAQVAASEQRSALVEKHYQEYGLERAERIASLVVDDGLSEAAAIAQTADNEANLEADFDEWEETDDENEPAYATTEAE